MRGYFAPLPCKYSKRGTDHDTDHLLIDNMYHIDHIDRIPVVMIR